MYKKPITPFIAHKQGPATAPAQQDQQKRVVDSLGHFFLARNPLQMEAKKNG